MKLPSALDPYIGAIKAVGGLVLAGVLCWALYQAYDWAYTNGENAAKTSANKIIAEMAAAEAEAQARARKREQAFAAALADIAAKYLEELQDAEADEARLVADLRAGNERLHARWRSSIATCDVSSAAARAAELDAQARDREESAARAIRAADEADAQIAGLQAVIEADRRK